jgi:PAS domain S-box-containing protein
MLGYSHEEMLKLTINDIDPGETPEVMRQRIENVEHIKEKGYGIFETKHKRKDGTLIDVEVSASFVPIGEEYFLVFTRDITDRKRAEAERESTIHLLSLLNKHSDLNELITEVAEFMREWSGCEEVDIQLGEDGNILYFETEDYSEKFAQPEKSAGADEGAVMIERSDTALRCMCGEVMCDRINACRENFTPNGSFWTNSVTDILGVFEKEGAPSRSRRCCIEHDGYESIALVPLRYGTETLGLFHFKDTRPDRFDEYMVSQFERLGVNLALGILERISQQALVDSEKKYRRLVELSPGLIAIQRGEKFVFINRTGAALLGANDPDEIIGRSIYDFMYPGFQNLVNERVVGSMEDGGRSPVYEQRVICLDGTEKFIEVVGTRVLFEGDTAVLINAHDITERIRIEEALLQSEEKFRNLFESSKDPIFFTSVEGKFLDVNRAGELLFGFPKHELYKMNVQDFYHDPDDRDIFRGIIEKHGFVKDYEIVYKNENGETIDCLETAVLTRSNDDGSIVGYQGIIRDVSEKKKLEEQVIRAQKMEAIGTLAGGIAHDFNNILATIMGYSSFLKSKAAKYEELFDGLDIIEKASVRASELTSQLLAYTRKSAREVKTLNVNRIVSEVYGLISKTFEKSIDISLDAKQDVPPIEGDESQIYQVLMNITVNAQHAMPKGGTIEIKTFSERIEKVIENTYFNISPGDYVTIRVSDTGIRMDRETLSRIFEPYFTTRGDHGGSGLGMSVVFGIVKSHNGCILIDSSPGKGTVVTLHFPVSRKSESDLRPLSEDIIGGTECVLIVDDEITILEMTSTILKESGYTIFSANTGKKGIELYREIRPDLVILDFKMPDMDGRDVLTELMGIDSNVRVLIATGFVDSDNRKFLMESGAIGFIRKPFKTREIIAKVREVLEMDN